MAEENTDYRNLSVEDRCVHKLWKARVDGYEEAIKIFCEINDKKSIEWKKFINLIKNFVIDPNVTAQEKGLEATLIFVKNCDYAGTTVCDVISGIVRKCFASSKAKIKDFAIQIILMYIEIEKHDCVSDELLKGTEHKNPKIVAACTSAITLALKQFGIKVINVKSIIKILIPIMSDRDKSVRNEGKQLAIEIYRWIGDAMKPQIASLPSVLVTELENEFDKFKGQVAQPTRYLKSQQEKQQTMPTITIDIGNDIKEEEKGETEKIDSLDLIDPVDVLSKLPKDFYEKLEAKKWQERKESLEILETLLENPQLTNGDYADLVKALKKVLTKDTNVLLVAMAGKCLASLAKGLGKNFSVYATTCVPAILEKFKEKKSNVVTALRGAIDAIYPSITLEAIQIDISEALNNKNHSVKAETASFLARTFTITQPSAFNKKLLEVVVTGLLKTLNESDPTVRDNSAEALGALLKLMGEKTIGCYLTDLDALKMAKIRECQEKTLVTKISGAKKDRPMTAPSTKKQSNLIPMKGGSMTSKSVLRPSTAGLKRQIAGSTKGAGGTQNPILKSSSILKIISKEKELPPEEVAAHAEDILTADILSSLGDANWKTRLSASEEILAQISRIEPNQTTAQILFRTLNNKKPGLKDTNFQVLNMKLNIVQKICEVCPVTTISANFIVDEVIRKLGDPKNSSAACQALTAIAEATKLEYVVSKVLTFAFEQKSLKVQTEALNWINRALKEFGFQVNPKLLIENIRKAVQSTNHTLRNSGIALIGTMSIYLGGNCLILHFDREKPTLIQQIQAEIDKNVGQKPPLPIRGVKTIHASTSSDNEDNRNSGTDSDSGGINEEIYNGTDLLPRNDISSQITESLLSEISDKNWKIRNEGLTKLQSILNDTKSIKPSIGDLPHVLSQRLTDSNAKIAQTAVAICEQLAISMGPSCKTHIRVLFPAFLHGLGDNKIFIRSALLSCINAWGNQCGFKEFFNGQMLADALKTGNPDLKTELWGWLAENVPKIPVKSIPKEELMEMLPYLYANISDRNANVRKNSNEAVLGIMAHLGYDAMIKALDKQNPTSKTHIRAALDKAKSDLVTEALPKDKSAAIIDETQLIKQIDSGVKTIRGGQKNSKTVDKPMTSRKRDEKTDTSPLLVVNNLKNQRLIDEQKMKILKCVFISSREEFTELLKEQMMTASINKNLITNMFHDDFRYHLKVIDSLIDDLPNNSKALTSNLDLILKWLSLRFCNTNPSVLLKGLEYLEKIFEMLVENEYILAENEGNSFIPHLVIKIGDSNHTVRNRVRLLLRQICLVYPIKKMFMYIIDGLKSKNARQRTECLEELSYLIDTYGITICHPTPQIALKEIAHHISDRDNSVRSAALNCIVKAYFIQGDKIYELIGQLTEKNLSMLDERIKRAKKIKRPLSSKKDNTEEKIITVQDNNIEIEKINLLDESPGAIGENRHSQSSIPNSMIPIKVESDSLKAEEKRDNPAKLTRQATFDQPNPTVLLAQQQKSSKPFGLDPNIITEIEKDWIRVDQMKSIELPKIDLKFLYEPIELKSVNGVSYPVDRFEKLLSRSRIPQPLTNDDIYNTAHNSIISNNNISPRLMTKTTQNLAETLPKLDPYLTKLIQLMGSTDRVTARAAINEIDDILKCPEKQAVLRDYEEMFIQNVITQYKNLSQLPQSESIFMYESLLSISFEFFNSKYLGKRLGVSCLKNVMFLLLSLSSNQKLSHIDDGKYQKILNGIYLKVLDTTNFTNLNCALICLLKEVCSRAGLPQFIDLLLKCLWRIIKMMPDRSNEIYYDAILYEIHEFLLALPSAWWKQRPSDLALRTIKTIIYNMVKIRRSSILQHLTKIPNHSELHACLIKMLMNLQNNENVSNSNVSPQELSSTENFSHILKLISNEETSRQGLVELYEFKRTNPNVDVPFLESVSPSFLKYIEDGLSEIKKEQLSQQQSSRHTTNVDPDRKLDPDYWMERLNALKLRANLIPKTIIKDDEVADENLNSESNAIKDNFKEKWVWE